MYGGERIEVPNPPPRRLRILELRATGLSIDAIARSLGCTRRRVFQVMAEARMVASER
jgi:transcriptional regulator